MTQEHFPPSDAELARYLSGECTPGEATEIERWLAADSVARRRVDAMLAVWRTAEAVGPKWDVDRMWAAVRPARQAPSAAPPTPRRRLFTSPGWSWTALAAVMVLAVGLSGWFGRIATRSDPGRNLNPMREVVTTTGQRAEVRLGDGSRVLLGVDSRLRFPVTLGAESRDLELFGEAYFEVQHDAKRPFRVRAGGVITEDRGTEFVIRTYAGDSAVRVAVVSGEVVVRREANDAAAGPSTTLVRGDLATVGGDGPVSVAHNADIDLYMGWVKGRIEFRATGLAEVARELGRWYGVEVRLAGAEVERHRLTASFRNESIEQVLHLITASLGLKADRAGDVVTLRLK